MSETLFAEPTPTAPAAPADPAPAATAPTISIPAEAAGLIGEGRKYRTVEDALAALPHAQSHIAILEQENHEFKEKLLYNDKLDQVLDKLNTPAPQPVEPTAAPVDGISREELSMLVQQEIAQRETVNLEQANLSTVESKLREAYGEDVATVFNTKASEVGMSPAQLTALAKVAPEAVITLVGGHNKSTTASPQPTGEGLNLDTVGSIGDPEPPRGSVMFGASTQEAVAEWHACAPKED
jgi:hypothetical protein